MKYLLINLAVLIFGMGTLAARPSMSAAATDFSVVVTTTDAQPVQAGLHKSSYLQRVKTFVKTLVHTLISKPSKGLLILLAFLIPWLAVGLATDWEAEHLIVNILLSVFTCLGGLIHAIIIVNKYAS